MKKLLLAAVISLSAAAAFAGDHAERQIYGDPNFEQNRVKAVKMLEQRGYQVHECRCRRPLGKPVLEVEAYKNGVNTISCCLILT